MTSYLCDRSLRVVCGSNSSSVVPLVCFVLQGSVLGPHMFITYTTNFADFAGERQVNFHSFADDSQSAVQACCDSPSLSSAPSSKVPCQLTTVCQSPKFLVACICDLPDVINCQFRKFAGAPLRPMHILSLYQHSGIQCSIICSIQLLTLHNLGGT